MDKSFKENLDSRIEFKELAKDLPLSMSSYSVIGIPYSLRFEFIELLAEKLKSSVIYSYTDTIYDPKSTITCSTGMPLEVSHFNRLLNSLGYERVDIVESPYQYSLHGGNYTISLNKYEIRIELLGNNIESINVRDIQVESAFMSITSAIIISRNSNLEVLYIKNSQDIVGMIGFDSHQGDYVYDFSNIVVNRAEKIDLHSFKFKRPLKKEELFFDSEVSIDDFVVHEDHGIAKFGGIKLEKNLEGQLEEYFELIYAKGDRLLVPKSQVDRITKYMGSKNPSLSSLGTAEWKNIKARVRKSMEKMASELLRLYAVRSLSSKPPLVIYDEREKKLEDSFEFVETPDQLKAWEEIKSDLESDKPMDRLLVGDVGFGKTELALRAAFRTFLNGKQTAILVPTTILANQHYEVFSKRYAPFNVRVKKISRLQSNSENDRSMSELKDGELDVIIGTHKLLSTKVSFANLGLLVIDEEQKFGVKQKELLKQYKTSVDVLSLTATPIPRTLYMALSGVRTISTLSTPPINRVPIKTYKIKKDWGTIGNLIQEEVVKNKGQAYFVHNRVNDIYGVWEKLKSKIDVKFGVAHGKLSPRSLEKVVKEFREKHIDVLVCTSIIESGIDMPNVNLAIVDNAYKFGLSQLYQIRGRVGRSANQARCYLVTDDENLTDVQQDRINAIMSAQTLGSGFDIANKDMQIRGVGNILGEDQHGNIEAIGFELYYRLLESTIEKEKSHLS